MNARPFVKHAGGKTSLLTKLLEHVPQSFGTYYEPFVGGGALFFALKSDGRCTKAVLNDSNKRLIQTYRAIKRSPEEVIALLRRMKNNPEFFLRVRKRKVDQLEDYEVAAWYIYLNKTCFNGLYRVNLKNEFNVPFGHYKNPKILDEENIQACSQALRNTTLRCNDFVVATRDATEGDVVYFDPPYYPRVGHEFVSYGPEKFTNDDHVRLMEHAKELKSRGVCVIISNSGAAGVRAIYMNTRLWKLDEVWGKRSIGPTELQRGTVPDLIIR